jgi:hypothetical protein
MVAAGSLLGLVTLTGILLGIVVRDRVAERASSEPAVRAEGGAVAGA